MSYIDFASQEPVKYGRRHRKSMPTARIETHNQMQIQKENRRAARTTATKKASVSTKSSQHPAQAPQRQRQSLNPGAQSRGSVTPQQMHGRNAAMPVAGAPPLHAGALRMPAPGDDQAAYIPTQLDRELEPPTHPNNQYFSFDDPDAFEIAQDPHADERDSDADADNQGSDEEGNNHAVAMDEGLRALDSPVDNQITSTPVDLAQPQRTLVRRTVNHSSPAISTLSPLIAYHVPVGPTIPYATNPRQLTRRAHLSTDTPSSSPTPAPSLKRAFAEVEDGRDERDQDSDGDDEGDDVINVPGPGRAADLPPARRRIFDLAAGHLRLSVVHEAPYADGIQLDKMAVNAWYTAYKELRESHGYQGTSPPTYDELMLLKKRYHQVKGSVKTNARDVVIGKKGYNFKEENTPAAIAHNRQLVTDLIEKNKFLYRDPTNPSIPGSLFEHPALQELLNRVFYNDEGNSEAVLIPKYFALGLSDQALAFFANTLLCVITEYQTGERVKSRMWAKTWQPSYEKLLRTIQDWKAFTTNSGSNLTKKLQVRMIQNARQYKRSPALRAGSHLRSFVAGNFLQSNLNKYVLQLTVKAGGHIDY
ncbi:hypothetical protein B0H19DRAFT_1276574 [Mycena capillaripes]|nr:hypothetical protein B0H19DRAFT_1276574 [Mycena capillaripes]